MKALALGAGKSERWKFWKWHIHRCRTESNDSGCWGECIVCRKRFGFVSRDDLRAYCDIEIEREMRRFGQKEKPQPMSRGRA